MSHPSYGLYSVLASGIEGVEINLLGLAFNINSDPPAIKLSINCWACQFNRT
jgi:hypothetical protein